MPTTLFSSLTEKDKKDAIERIISESSPRHDFFLMTALAILMATFGLIIDSAPVVIGSMLIAPILFPVLGMSLGVVMANSNLIIRSFFTLIKSLAVAIPASTVVTLLFMSLATPGWEQNAEIISRLEPTVIYAAIAFIAGLAASFAMIKPQLSESLPGVAISVALIPPLGVTGIGLARLDWGMITNSFVLFLVNALMIIFASLITFSLMNLYVKRVEAVKVVEKEDKKIEKEKERAEKEAEKNKPNNDK